MLIFSRPFAHSCSGLPSPQLLSAEMKQATLSLTSIWRLQASNPAGRQVGFSGNSLPPAGRTLGPEGCAELTWCAARSLQGVGPRTHVTPHRWAAPSPSTQEENGAMCLLLLLLTRIHSNPRRETGGQLPHDLRPPSATLAELCPAAMRKAKHSSALQEALPSGSPATDGQGRGWRDKETRTEGMSLKAIDTNGVRTAAE